MKQTVITCDSCGSDKCTKEVRVYIDKVHDGAEWSPVWDSVDLCAGCMAKALENFLDSKGNVAGHRVEGAEWVARWKKVQK